MVGKLDPCGGLVLIVFLPVPVLVGFGAADVAVAVAVTGGGAVVVAVAEAVSEGVGAAVVGALAEVVVAVSGAAGCVSDGAALAEPEPRGPPPRSTRIATESDTMITPIAAPMPIQRRDVAGAGAAGRGTIPCGARRIGAVDERAPSACGLDGAAAGA